jgi:DNA-binding XRE family transcriptional regulator
MPHTNYLRFHRKQWALSQREVAHLVGHRARSVVSAYELGRIAPWARYAVAYQFVFGVRLETLFPGMTREVEEEVVRRAAELDRASRGREDAGARRKLELLGEIVSRADDPSDA